MDQCSETLCQKCQDPLKSSALYGEERRLCSECADIEYEQWVADQSKAIVKTEGMLWG